MGHELAFRDSLPPKKSRRQITVGSFDDGEHEESTISNVDWGGSSQDETLAIKMDSK